MSFDETSTGKSALAGRHRGWRHLGTGSGAGTFTLSQTLPKD
jgi:hypothetical protein